MSAALSAKASRSVNLKSSLLIQRERPYGMEFAQLLAAAIPIKQVSRTRSPPSTRATLKSEIAAKFHSGCFSIAVQLT